MDALASQHGFGFYFVVVALASCVGLVALYRSQRGTVRRLWTGTLTISLVVSLFCLWHFRNVSDAPINVSVQTYSGQCGYPVLFPGKSLSNIGKLGSVQGNARYSKWVAENGGIDVASGSSPGTGASWSQLVVSGASNDPVVVTRIRTQVVSTEPSVDSGPLYEQQCGGPLQSRFALFDLDTTKLVASGGGTRTAR